LWEQGVSVLQAFVEIVKALAWPLVVGGIVWLLWDQVKDSAKRITELGLSGAKFAPPPVEQIPTPPTTGVSTPLQPPNQAGTPAATQPGSAQQLIQRVREFITPDQLDPAVQNIRRELTALGANKDEQIEVLIHVLGSVNIQLTHQRVYGAIYGSQLQLLALMNTDDGAPPNGARQIYEAAKAQYPEVYRNYPFEAWMGFLHKSGLIDVAANANYVLTSYGRGLLRYVIDRHLPTNKPY
jgi:hypothetical protein